MPTLETSSYQAVATQIVQDVFTLMLGNSAELCQDRAISEEAERITATVSFVGSWSGATVLQCGLPLARKVSAQLMGIAEDAQSTEDVCDSIGELINMIGGNLKSLLPRGVVLSTPSVRIGVDNAHVAHPSRGQTFCFHCEWGPFWLTLVELPE